MLKKMMEMETSYVSNYSHKEEMGNIIRFSDDHLPDMYTNNFTLIDDRPAGDELVNIIREELKVRREQGHNFLRLELNFPVDKEQLADLPLNPEMTVYDFMYLEVEQGLTREGNPDCRVVRADNPENLQDAIKADIAANQPIMGEFAERRIARKAEIYSSAESPIDFYVCYHQQQPIGTCELMVQGQLAKIEDFDIIEAYQRKGFGTSVLQHLVEESRQAGAKTVYLITEKADTAKEMYLKCGFTKLGEKTELFFDLTQSEFSGEK